jgi:ribosomal protein S18 acetylase RimI-like enzyme
MIAPAHAGHIDALRHWIRAGAAEGSFDAELAVNSAESDLFFANLRLALVTGQFVQRDPAGQICARSASGYIYWPDDDGDRARPVGFGLFKALGLPGYELWLAGLDTHARGRGHGRAMLCALLGTPTGRMAYVVRVNRHGRGGAAMLHLLESLGFRIERETPEQTWLVRSDAHPALAARIRGARLATANMH